MTPGATRLYFFARAWLTFSLCAVAISIVATISEPRRTNCHSIPSASFLIYDDSATLRLISEYDEAIMPEPKHDQAVEQAAAYVSVRAIIQEPGLFRPWFSYLGRASVSVYPTTDPPQIDEQTATDMLKHDATLARAFPNPITRARFHDLESFGVVDHWTTGRSRLSYIYKANIAIDLGILAWATSVIGAFAVCARCWNAHSTRTDTRCQFCGYPRTGLPNSTTNCPECGTPFTKTLGEKSITLPR